MSESHRAYAEIDIRVLGAREMDFVVNAATKLQDKLELTGKEAERFERIAVKLKKSVAELRNQFAGMTPAQVQNLKTITAQEKAYRSYAESIKVAAQAQRDLAASQKAAMATYQPNIDATRRRETTQVRDQDAAFRSYAPNIRASDEQARVERARKANADIIALEEKTRQQQLAALRSDIQQRSAAEAKAQDIRLRDAQRTNAAMVAQEQRARQQELGALRSAIQERDRLQQQSSKAQLQYASQAQRAGLQYGQNLAVAANANDRMISQRYALYDVATTWGVVSAATLGAAGAALKVAIDYETAFASVQRTSGAAGTELANLRDDLVDLTTTLPTSFANIAEIATLGGQLGIAADGIDDFTRVTAQLTATTNLSAEAAGTALGRFQALLGVPSSQFENLGSSILKVGVNSVATETQIVNIATQISSMGDFAGLTADQVIGLSGALASVGAQPELSRGTITRTFTLMSNAVASGGAALDEFARVSGVSAEEFRSNWGTAEFANTFQDFLAGIGEEGGNATRTLADLGITSVRDVPLLLRLAKAGKVVDDAFRDAAEGFEDATELQEQYAIVADTTAARLTMLANTFKAVIDAVGSGALGPLGDLLNILQGLSQSFLDLARTDIGQKFLGTAAAVGVLVGALAAYRSVQALTIASLLAMRTAQEALGASSIKSATTLRGMVGTFATMAVGTDRATRAQLAYNGALDAGRGKIAATAAGLRGLATASTGAAAGFRALASATVWMAALGAGVALLTQWSQAQEDARLRVEALTGTIDSQTGAFTELSREMVLNDLIESGAAAKAQALGLSMETVVDAALGQRSAIAELRAEQERLNAVDVTGEGGALDADAYNAAKGPAQDMTDVLKQVGIQSEAAAEAQQNAALAREAGIESTDAAIMAEEDFGIAVQETVDAMWGSVDGTLAMQNALYGLGQSLYDNGTSFDVFSVGGRANLEALQQTISAMVTASGGDSATLAVLLQGLMNSLASYGVNAVEELAFVQNMVAQLAGSAGIDMEQVKVVTNEASHALGQGFVAGSDKAARSASRTGKSARDAAKEIRTLSDYVSDLSKVFSDAFEFRFELEQSVDDTAEALAKFGDYTDDAAESVRDARMAIAELKAELRSLSSDRDILEYQLKVATEYGDTLRANEILAELAENTVDTKKAQADLRKENKNLSTSQAALSKNLSGSTEGSREQREMVLDLVESYQKQVLALANTGMSQEQLAAETSRLRAQFVQQLTQMGYNRAEVDRYASAFDDLTYAISRVPRNITVKTDVNTKPAERALEEFIAKANRQSISVNVGGVGGDNTGLYQGLRDTADRAVSDGVANAARRIVKQKIGPGEFDYRYSFDGGRTWALNKGGQVGSGVQYHATGGVHGMHPGSPRGKDTTPAWLTPGEFVHTTQAVDYYGLPFMNALNNMQIPKYLATGGPVSTPAPTASGSGGGIGLVELLPNQLSALMQAQEVHVYLDGKEITAAVNKTNFGSARRGTN